MVGRYYGRKEMINEAMNLWCKYGSDYRTLLAEYNFHLNAIEKSELKLDFKKLGNSFLDEYPKIEYMECICQYDAERYLEMLDSYLILEQLREAENFNVMPIVDALREKNAYLQSCLWRARHSNKNNNDRSRYATAVLPESCSSGRHTGFRKISCT